jgi:hypothetical protein
MNISADLNVLGGTKLKRSDMRWNIRNFHKRQIADGIGRDYGTSHDRGGFKLVPLLQGFKQYANFFCILDYVPVRQY